MGVTMQPTAVGVLYVLPALSSISSLIFCLRNSALQGSFSEHVAALQRIAPSFSPPLEVVAVRTPVDLALCRALIIPGGESTTISLLIRKSGLYEPLQEMVKTAKEGGDRALWGTCAGMILLAKQIDGPTSEGWEGLDGMDVRVARNQYGRQVRPVSHFLPEREEATN
jgi:5'-phosphate synthase pdxT subunit